MKSSSSFIDDLKPQDKRYDLEIDVNLFISVLPNGVKTWVLCDMVEGKPRRKTLGVYPQLSLSRARDFVEEMRNDGEARPRMHTDLPAAPRKSAPAPALTIRDGRIVNQGPPAARIVLGALIVLLVIAIVAFIGFRISAATSSSSADTQVTVNSTPAPQNLAASRTTQTQPVPEPLAVALVTPDRAAAAVDTGHVVTRSASAGDIANGFGDTQLSPRDAISAAPVEAPAPKLNDVASEPLPAAPVEAPAPKPNDIAREPLSAATNPAPNRGVARYQLTSQIDAREPVDNLRSPLSGEGSNPFRVYFFTDLRGLTGETVSHRWLYQGDVSAVVPFNVGAWRWRVYSSKDLLPHQAGDWSIEVATADGELLAAESFSFQP